MHKVSCVHGIVKIATDFNVIKAPGRIRICKFLTAFVKAYLLKKVVLAYMMLRIRNPKTLKLMLIYFAFCPAIRIIQEQCNVSTKNDIQVTAVDSNTEEFLDIHVDQLTLMNFE